MYYVGLFLVGVPLGAFVRYWVLIGLASLAAYSGFDVDADAAHTLSVYVAWVLSAHCAIKVALEREVEQMRARTKALKDNLERITAIRAGMRSE